MSWPCAPDAYPPRHHWWRTEVNQNGVRVLRCRVCHDSGGVSVPEVQRQRDEQPEWIGK